MLTFADKIKLFITNYREFLDIYDAGFSYDGESLTALTVGWKSLLRSSADKKDKEQAIFIGITSAICKLINPNGNSGRVYSVTTDDSDFQVTLYNVVETLRRKNQGYGDAALTPNRFYSDALTTSDCILIRLSDKIARYESLTDALARDSENSDVIQESLYDTTLDFIGYCILLYIAFKIDDEPFLLYGEVDELEVGSEYADTDEEKAERPLPAMVFPYRPTFRDISDTLESGNFDIFVAPAKKASNDGEN